MATTTTKGGVVLQVPRPNVPDFSKVETGCGACPASVVAKLAMRVQISLDQVVAAQRLADEFSKLWSMVDSEVVAQVNIAVGTIPDVPFPDITELVGFWTCPLTPLALALTFYDDGPAAALSKISSMDPRAAMGIAKDMLNDWLKSIRMNYEISLAGSSKNNVIKLIRKMVTEFRRLRFDAEAFAVATVIVATVKTTCPGSYAGSVFEKFEKAVVGFSLSSDLPSSITPEVAHVAATLILAEVKLDLINKVISDSIEIPTLPEIPYIPPIMV